MEEERKLRTVTPPWRSEFVAFALFSQLELPTWIVESSQLVVWYNNSELGLKIGLSFTGLGPLTKQTHHNAQFQKTQ